MFRYETIKAANEVEAEKFEEQLRNIQKKMQSMEGQFDVCTEDLFNQTIKEIISKQYTYSIYPVTCLFQLKSSFSVLNFHKTQKKLELSVPPISNYIPSDAQLSPPSFGIFRSVS